MDTISILRSNLQRRKGDWPSMCRDTGLSYGWVTKFAQGKICEPGLRKVEALQRYIADNPLDSAVNDRGAA